MRAFVFDAGLSSWALRKNLRASAYVDSGGDPEVIPNLSFEQFKAFHDSYYHPANGRFFFYGDDAPLARLELLDEYLQARLPRFSPPAAPGRRAVAPPRARSLCPG